MSAETRVTVLHYVGADDDRGGIVSVVRALAAADQFECVLGMNAGGRQRRVPALPAFELPALQGEHIGLVTFWRARAVARRVRAWLAAGPRRIFHGHSRAGMLVAFWLHAWGERRVAVTVHCYGRQRWFYRRMAQRLGRRLFWLSPAMKAYYGVGDSTWGQCLPGGIPPLPVIRAAAIPGRVRLGGVGALVRWKGWHLVVEALAVLPPAARARLTFTHIGGGDADYLAELQELARVRGVGAQVVFRGEESDAAGLLGEIDALVVASQNEPFSVALLEALHAGVPVLAADSGGTRDVISPGRNGWLFTSGSVADLARHLERIADGAVLAQLHPPAALLERFTAEAAAGAYLGAYRALGLA